MCFLIPKRNRLMISLVMPRFKVDLVASISLLIWVTYLKVFLGIQDSAIYLVLEAVEVVIVLVAAMRTISNGAIF